eukprot:g8796.t1
MNDGQPENTNKAASLRKLSSRLAVATFAGILVLYTTTLRYSGNAVDAIHYAQYAPDITNGNDHDGDLSSEALMAAAARSAPERGDDGGEQFAWTVKKPNEGRTHAGSVGVRVDTGARSPHYGDIQRRHQDWLTRKAQQLGLRLERNADRGRGDSNPNTSQPAEGRSVAAGEDKDSTTTSLPPPEGKLETTAAAVGRDGRGTDVRQKTPDEAEDGQSSLRGVAAAAEAAAAVEERIFRVNTGARLWEETYVPPIEPARRRELIEKWTGATWSPPESVTRKGHAPPTGRILYVISSFDRGERLGKRFRNKTDKLNFVLMMLDEMREACEVGFSPEVHLLAAWDPSVMLPLVQDRLFCERTGQNVPFSFQEYPHSVGNRLSAKHRIYMKDRLELFDIFLQVEDDMILTLNHILMYREESELLDNRIASASSSIQHENAFVPGFIRVEPGARKGDGEGGEVRGDDDTWVEWEIMLSRFFPTKVAGAGTYLTLRKSIPAKGGGEYGENNQGLWMATREQLRKLSERKRCKYLDFDEDTRKGHPETHSGSIQMFSKECGFDKVFPATHFEDFLVHHRANNKAGLRGESNPGVPIRMLREWAEQFIRDEGLLVPED